MSRTPRAGSAGTNITFRATDAERAAWERAAEASGCASLSAWMVMTLNARTAGNTVEKPALTRRNPRRTKR